MLNSAEKALFSAKVENGVNSHAYIVDGPAGVGKLDFALYCARALLCTGKHKPCGVCESCVKAGMGEHPDIFVVGDGEKAASINDVRELVRRGTLKPNDGERQVFIVNGADKLRSDAQNALLKIFEEPPESVVIFLLTESRSSLLPTVLSRGQRVRLDGLGEGELLELLSAEFPAVPGKDIAFAAAAAQGNLGEARRMLSPDTGEVRGKAAEIMRLALAHDRYGLLIKLVAAKYKRDKLEEVLKEFVALCDSAAKVKYGFAGDYGAEAVGAAARSSKRALARMAESATLCLISLAGNANVTAATAKLASDLVVSAAG